MLPRPLECAWTVLSLALLACGGRARVETVTEPPSGVPNASAVPPTGAPPQDASLAPPPPVAGPGRKASRISMGGLACARMEDGTVSCWGGNPANSQGNAGVVVTPLPVAVEGLTNVTSVSCGGGHTCALKDDGTVWCWGWNSHGQVGDGTTIGRDKPTPVVGLTNIVEVSAGSLHTCARRGDGAVFCWGFNSQGQLGLGTTSDAVTTPTQVPALAGAEGISAGDLLTCARVAGGKAQCWGDDANGQVGDGVVLPSTARPTPVDVSGLGSGVLAISAGSEIACAVRGDLTVQCWGWNPYGALGNGTTRDSATPSTVRGISTAQDVRARTQTSCALLQDHSVQCWGDNSQGQLGDGTTIPHLAPAPVVGLPSTVVQVEIRGFSACALLASGDVKCWGDNRFGQLGDGTTAQRLAPTPVAL